MSDAKVRPPVILLITSALSLAAVLTLYRCTSRTLDIAPELMEFRINASDMSRAHAVAVQWNKSAVGSDAVARVRDTSEADSPVWVVDPAMPLGSALERERYPKPMGYLPYEQAPTSLAIDPAGAISPILVRPRSDLRPGSVEREVAERLGGDRATGILFRAVEQSESDPVALPVLLMMVLPPEDRDGQLAVSLVTFAGGIWRPEMSHSLVWSEDIVLIDFPDVPGLLGTLISPVRIRGDEGTVGRRASQMIRDQLNATDAEVAVPTLDDDSARRVSLFARTVLQSAVDRVLSEATPLPTSQTLRRVTHSDNELTVVAVADMVPATSFAFGWPVWWQRVLNGSDVWGVIQLATVMVFGLALGWVIFIAICGLSVKQRLEGGKFFGFVLPSIGFVGTVVGIGQAPARIGDVLADDAAIQQAALRDMGASLSTAFDTTLCALVLTIVFSLLLHAVLWWKGSESDRSAGNRKPERATG